jgi:hypothetical protein
MKTTLYTVLCIAIRLGAVLMAVGLLQTLPAFLWGSSDGHFALLGLSLGGFGLIVAIALWMWPGMLAWLAVRQSRNEAFESSIEADQMQRIAFSVLGAWLCIHGLLGCFSHGVLMLFVRSQVVDPATLSIPIGEWRLLIEYAATAVAGAALMLGAHGLVGLLHRLRDYPHSRDSGPGHDAKLT